MIHIATAADGNVVGQQLQRDYLNERAEQLDGRRDVDDVLDQAANGCVAFGGNGYYAAGAGGDLLDVGDRLLVTEL